MNERQERRGELVVARSDASEVFDAAKETLDPIAVFVDVFGESSWVESIGAWPDNGLTALHRNHIDESVRIVTLVGDDELRSLILDQQPLLARCRQSGRPRE